MNNIKLKKLEASSGFIRSQAQRSSRAEVTARAGLFKLGVELSLDDLAKGLDVTIQILALSGPSSYSWRLYKWGHALIKRVSKADGVQRRMSQAKNYFTVCRMHAMRPRSKVWGGFPPVPLYPGCTVTASRVIFHQVSRCSRSLRLPDDAAQLRALKEHWDLSQSTFTTSPTMRASFKKFVRERFGSTFTGAFSGPGDASSFTFTKAAGGACQEIRTLTDAYMQKEVTWVGLLEEARAMPQFILKECPRVFDKVESGKRLCQVKARNQGLFETRQPLGSLLFPYDKESELSLVDWEAKRDILFSLVASWKSIDFSAPPRCRQVPVAERGFKTRVATPLEAPFRYLLSCVNGGLLSVLESVPETVNSLHGRAAEKLVWGNGVKRNAVFSADLRAATDRFPQDLMFDAIDVLSEGWPAEMRSLAIRSVSPHLMTRSPFLGAPLRAMTKRGILMGSPVSWPLLAIYSTWLHFESGSDGWFGVCGDDYIGCHTKKSYDRYISLRKWTGALGSPGKDLMGFEGVGNFAEDLVSVHRRKVYATTSVRAVMGDPKSGLPGWAQGPEVTIALEQLHLPPSSTFRLVRTIHSASIKQLRSVNVDPFGPRWIGGAGFPGIPLPSTLRLARVAVSQRPKDVLSWTTSFGLAWSQSTQSEALSDAVQEDIGNHAEFAIDTGELGAWGPLRDIVSSRIGQLAWSFSLAGFLGRESALRLSSVSDKIKGVSKKVLERGFWMDHTTIKSGEGIRDMLEKLEPLSRPIPFPSILPSVTFCGPAPFKRLARKRKRGPGHPDWGGKARPGLTVM